MGFARNRVIGMSDEDLDQFLCQICLDIITDPVVTQCCRQTYCSECINNWLSEHNSCPNDRRLLTTEDLISSPRLVSNLLDQMKVKCVYGANGCQAIVRRSESSEHEMYCESNPEKKCRTCGLNASIGSEHNCVENLLNKIERISTEMSELKEQIQAMSTQSNVLDISLLSPTTRNQMRALVRHLINSNLYLMVASDPIDILREIRSSVLTLINEQTQQNSTRITERAGQMPTVESGRVYDLNGRRVRTNTTANNYYNH